jgi:predicted permease
MAWWDFWRRRRELDLEDELAHDFAATIDEKMRDGAERVDAEQSARRDFGSVTAIRERVHDTWGWGRTERFWQDVRYGLRNMRRTPALTTVIVLTFMLGIGANAVVFSVIDAVLLRPLPYRDPGRVMFMSAQPIRFARLGVLDGDELLEWRRDARSFDSLGGYLAMRDSCTIGAATFDAGIAHIFGDLPGVLGLTPAIGRSFLPEEMWPVPGRASHPVALISDAVFRENSGGDPGVLGRMIVTIRSVPYTVIGVLPRDLPLRLPGLDAPLLGIDVVVNRDAGPFGGPTQILGRLAAGTTVEAARSEMGTLHARYVQEHPNRAKSQLRMIPLHDRVVGDARFALLMLWAIAGIVLLVACANVTNLLLARAAARGREIAVRAALGASRGRLIRQLLTESVVLAALGGIAGLAVAYWGTRVVANQITVDIPRLNEATTDWTVFAFCLSVCMTTGMLAGLAPALGASRSAVPSGERTAASVSKWRHRLHSVLVVSELAVALVVLTGAGLMLKSLWIIRAQTSLFAPQQVLETNINARQVAAADVYLDDLTGQLEALPGVTATAAFSQAGVQLQLAGLPPPPSDQKAMLTVVRVSRHYKAAAGVVLVSGRWLTDDDLKGTPPVTVINESLFRILSALYPDNGPVIGKQIDVGGMVPANPTIVGVVRSLQRRPDADPEPQMFVPSSWWPLNGIAQYFVRTSGDPMALVGPIQKIVSRTPGVQMRGTQTAEDELLLGLAPRRLQTTLLVTFACLALLLAMAGTYGVLSYGVSERITEIGVRLALGAQRGDVLALVLGRAAKLAALGVTFGSLGAVGASRFITSLLYGVLSTDPWTYGAVALVLFLIAILAAYLPARRATRVDAMVALRNE